MKSLIYLTQSDTTAGFLSEDFKRLNHIKGRNVKQDVLLTLDTLHKLKNLVRVPNKHKNRVRKSTKSTFIYTGKNSLEQESLAIRLVCATSPHREFLSFFPFLYSGSANAHKAEFDLGFALERAEVLVLDSRLLSAQNPSKMYKITQTKIKRVR